MSIIQVTGSGGSVQSDRTPFYGGRVPPEISLLIKPLGKCEKQTVGKILQLIVSSMEGKPVNHEQFKELSNETLTEEILSIIYSGLYSLLKRAIRLPLTSLKPEMFKEDMCELQIPSEFQEDISSVVFGSRRPRIENKILDSRPRLPKIEQLKWRVDVAISTSVLNRVLEPTILMEMKLSNGRIHLFEVPVSQFHQLRYNVAYVLKEMEDLEKKSILKIQD
ncbi:COMM domain-containing protein 5-like [Saccostrea echinata]|uniref:COMM domain-containing protein 5-like n=1 Tax=Saccostrea echinata TaxID=191078 RepID=UPI002A81D57D|nr:COMM domain-containing protein 5-like [Saccostrea echinata]